MKPLLFYFTHIANDFRKTVTILNKVNSAKMNDNFMLEAILKIT